MLSKEKINRINELANKSKIDKLSPEELEEQAALRKEYIESVRSSFRSQLNTITLVKVDEEGNEIERTPLKNKDNTIQ